MKIRWTAFLGLLSGLLFFVLMTPQVSANTGTYTVNSSGSIVNGGSTLDFESFLNNVQRNTISEVMALSTENLVNELTVTGGLEIVSSSGTASGGNLWTGDTSSSWASSESGTYFNFRAGSDTVQIYVPPGISRYTDAAGKVQVSKINQTEIANTINLLTRYKNTIKNSINIGSMQHSFNVYSFYPTKQVYIKELIDFPADGTEGKVKANASIGHTLDYLIHPFLGKLDSTKVKAQTSWEVSTGVNPSSANGSKVTFKVSDEYGAFLSNEEGRSTLSTLDSGAVSTSTGVVSVTSTKSKQVIKTQHGVDSTLRLAVPKKFTSYNANQSMYKLSDTEGYSVVDGIRLRVTTNHVYKFDDTSKSFKDEGAYENFNINLSSLVVSRMEINAEGEPETGTSKYIGVVIPLWYKEAIYIPSSSSATPSEDIYFTGRELRFSNDYSTKSSISGTNKDIFAIYTIEGASGGELRNYAFKSGFSDVSLEESHKLLDSGSPTSFEIAAGFHQTTTGYGGFTMYLNNANIEDRGLLSWLGSDRAQALSDIQATKLLQKIKGEMEITQDPYSYLEWNRLEEIRMELEESKNSRFGKWVYTTLFVFGILLSFYSTLLHFSYWLDRFNIFMEFQFMGFLTNGRLNADPEGVGLMKFRSFTPSEGGITYVTLGRLIVINCSLYILSLAIIQAPAVIRIIVTLYYTILDWVGM